VLIYDLNVSWNLLKDQNSISDASLFSLNKKKLKTLKSETLIILDASIKFFAEKNYERSANEFNQCKNLENDHLFLFTYCEAMCFIMSGNIDKVAKSLDLLVALEEVTSSNKEIIQSLAAYGLAKALYALKDCNTAKYKCECGISLLNSIEDTQSYALHSDQLFTKDALELFPQLHLSNLKSSFECLYSDTKLNWKPLAFCRGDECLDVNAKPYLNSERAIYETDIDFKGYYTLNCTNGCKIAYHVLCFKALKESEFTKNDRYFIGKVCKTHGCGGNVSNVLVYKENGYKKVLKSTNRN